MEPLPNSPEPSPRSLSKTTTTRKPSTCRGLVRKLSTLTNKAPVLVEDNEATTATTETEQPKSRNSPLLSRSATAYDKPARHRTSSSKKNVKHREVLHIDAQECDALTQKLAQYRPPNVFEESLKAYEAYKSAGGGNALINFHERVEYESELFCYAFGCVEADPTLVYTKCLTLCDYRQNYAGFDECAIFRIVLYCPNCLLLHQEKQAQRQDRTPFPVKINYAGYKLFSPL